VIIVQISLHDAQLSCAPEKPMNLFWAAAIRHCTSCGFLSIL